MPVRLGVIEDLFATEVEMIPDQIFRGVVTPPNGPTQ